MQTWSYSALKQYEMCPRKYKHKYIDKTYKEPVSVQQDWGLTVHKQLENRIKDKTQLPPAIRKYEGLATAIESLPGVKLVEQKLALDRNLNTVEWFDKHVWVRAVADLIVINNEQAVIIDWKTGKLSDDFTQLMLSSAMLFSGDKKVEQIRASFFWFKHNKPTTSVYNKKDVFVMWQKLLPRVHRMEAETNFIPKPSKLCDYCYVKECEYCPN